MTKSWKSLVALGVVVGMSGCARIQTRVVELPRVDQEVAGNQGYLQGRGAPAQSPRKATRQVLMTDVELMTRHEITQGIRGVMQQSSAPVKGELGPNGRGWRVPEAAAPTPVPAPEVSTHEAPVMPPPAPAVSAEDFERPPAEMSLPSPQQVAPAAPAASATTYTVQKGDTLEKIAKKVYGDTKRWPKIYKANREAIKNPNKLYPGQRLTIPALPSD